MERWERLAAALPEGFGAAIVKTAVNRFYLLDFDSHDAGTLLVFPGGMVFLIDSRYTEAAGQAVQGAEVVREERLYAQVADLLMRRGVQSVLVEEEISVATLRGFEKGLPGVRVDAGPALSEALGRLRQVKDDEETARMGQAQRITDACFAHILPFIKEGVRERDLALEMEFFMREQGAEGIAFDTICAAGPNSSRPHAVPGEYALQPGDFITMDFGARYKGYCADMTRTVALGFVSDEQQRVYDTVLAAHLAGIKAARAGVSGQAVDRAARDIIYAAGYEGCFGHGLGHAVGIDVHEEPRFSPACKTLMRAGMMMTVEPGIYLPGRFGCRIEDMVLIQEDGCRPLPQSPKELIIV